MKANLLILVGWLVLVSAIPAKAVPLMESVPVKLGPKAFRDGDVIQILEVESTSPKLEQGDSVTVRGRYRLDSEKSAVLSLYLTQTAGGGREETEPTQTLPAVAGWHDFELSILIRHRGFLHLTFYGQEGTAFGGVYFGTVEQMARAADELVAHYDVGTSRVIAGKERSEESGKPVKAVKLKYNYGFSTDVDALMGSVEESDPNQAAHPKVKTGVLFERGGEEPAAISPAGDLHQTWPPKEFRIENAKQGGVPEDAPKVEMRPRRESKEP